MYETLQKEMIALCRLSYNRGHVAATNGNISARTPDGRGVLIKASGVSFARIEPRDLLFIDWEARAFDCDTMCPSERRPSMELQLHLWLYPLSPTTGAVVHLHSPHATALSFGTKEIPLVVLEARHILCHVPVVPVHPAGSPELAEAVRNAFSRQNVIAAVLGEHGPIAVGGNLEEAYNVIDMLEHNAHVAILTKILGREGVAQSHISTL